jgi:hypothetical protein
VIPRPSADYFVVGRRQKDYHNPSHNCCIQLLKLYPCDYQANVFFVFLFFCFFSFVVCYTCLCPSFTLQVGNLEFWSQISFEKSQGIWQICHTLVFIYTHTVSLFGYACWSLIFYLSLSRHNIQYMATIVGRGSELRPPPPFQTKKEYPPTLSKIILPSRKSTTIGKKLTKSQQIAKISLKH